MREVFSFENDKAFNKFLILAFSLHLFIFLIAFTLQKLNFVNSTSKEIEIIQSSVRVDVVGMPKLTVKELKELEASPSVESSKGESAHLDNTKSNEEESSFNSFLKTYSKKETPKAKKQGDKKGTSLTSSNLKNLILEGNKVSQGTSLVGDSLKQEMTEYTSYIGNIPNVVRPNWKLPSYLMEKKLKCRVRIYIGSNGKLIKSEIFESSGEIEFDRRAQKAVSDVKTFPTPPKEIASRLISGDLILGFPL